MGQVTIPEAGTFDIYGELSTGADSANRYILARIGLKEAWAALEDEDRARCLVEATAFLEDQRWKGTKTSGVQALQWPRTGVTREDGTAVGTSEIPVEIVHACYELAALIMDTPGLQAEDPGSNIQEVNAAGAAVKFFRPTPGTGRFPRHVQEKIAQFLAGASIGEANPGGYSYGQGEMSDAVSEGTAFDDDFGITGGG